MDNAWAALAQKIVKEQMEVPSTNMQAVAKSLKEKFDSNYGTGWQCVVGNCFGGYVTHAPNCFLYFSVEPFSILLFRTAVNQ